MTGRKEGYKEDEMLDINIALDPVNDGAAFLSKKIIRKDEGSLVIATN